MSIDGAYADNLAEAHKLLSAGHFAQAGAQYEAVIARYRREVWADLQKHNNLVAHKNFMQCSLVSQILAQGAVETGFYVDFAPYVFLDRPVPRIFVSPKTIKAIDHYKRPCQSIKTVGSGILGQLAVHANAPTLLYVAYTVASDVVDLRLVNHGLPLAVGVDFGAGAGLQAVATALLNRDVAALYLFETQDFMIDSIVDLFDANGVDNYYLNVPLDQPADLFYSFKACGYLFGVETYFEQIRQNRSANARALMDIGYTQNLDQQRAKLMSIFRQSATMYRYGEAPYDSARTLFDEPY